METATPAWRMCTAEPADRLRGLVDAYTCFAEDHPGPVRRDEVAGPSVTLFVAGGSPLRFADAGAEPAGGLGSFVAGARDARVCIGHDGRHHGVGVHLSLPGALRLLGVPGGELAGAAVDLEDLLGRDAARLEERLLDDDAAPDERFALLDRYLGDRMGAGREPDHEVSWVHSRLAGRPNARVGDLAREVGWSRTRLTNRFGHQLGLSPKRFARLVRFTLAHRVVERTARPLSDVAYACGYADQAHLGREFAELSGHSPRVHRRLVHERDAIPEP